MQFRFPGCIILKNDSSYLQGVPDLTILHGAKWGTLEVKLEVNSPRQPNQDYYVARMNEMGFSAYIGPFNESEILDALEIALRPCGENPCVPQPK